MALRENIFMNFKVVGFKMPQELSDRIDECVAHLGVQRTAWVREVLADALKKAGFPIDPAILKPNQGARNDLPNRITEAEKRASRGRVRRAKKEVSRLALALGKSRTRAEARSLADKAVKPGED